MQKSFKYLLFFTITVFLAGCSSQKEAQLSPEEIARQQQHDKDKSAALQHFIDGSLFESKSDYAQAIIEYQDALRYDKDPAIYYALAKNYSALGKHALAAEMAVEAVKLDPGSTTYRQTLAEIYIKTYQFDLAVEQYRAILAIDSTDVATMFNIARLTQITKPLQALEMYERIIQRNGPEWDVLLQIVEINTSLRRFDKAAGALNQMLKIDPSNLALRRNLGEMYVRSEQYDKALEIYSDLLERDPNNVELRGALAGLYLQKGDWDKAREQFESILKNDSLTADARFRIGMAYLSQAQKDTSLLANTVQQFETFLKKYPDDWRTNSVELRGMLAELYLEQGEWNRAREQFEQILTRDSLNADIRFRIAMAYFGQAQKDSSLLIQSRMQLETMLSLYPKDWRPVFYLGAIFLLQKDLARALEYFEKVTVLAAWNADAWWYVGSINLDKREFAQTVELMEKAKQYVPKDNRIHFLLGLALARLNRNDEAISALREASKLDPKNINIIAALGDTYNALKKFKESDESYEAALAIDPHYALVLNNYAYSLSERGVDLERAQKMSKESLEKDSTNSSYLDTYGWILFKLGRYAEAEPYIVKAIAFGETNAVVFEHLGDVYYKSQAFSKAQEYWKKALDLDPTNNALKDKVLRGKL
jgi:tetratricopeptide (TPR) repeat protein